MKRFMKRLMVIMMAFVMSVTIITPAYTAQAAKTYTLDELGLSFSPYLVYSVKGNTVKCKKCYDGEDSYGDYEMYVHKKILTFKLTRGTKYYCYANGHLQLKKSTKKNFKRYCKRNHSRKLYSKCTLIFIKKKGKKIRKLVYGNQDWD